MSPEYRQAQAETPEKKKADLKGWMATLVGWAIGFGLARVLGGVFWILLMKGAFRNAQSGCPDDGSLRLLYQATRASNLLILNMVAPVDREPKKSQKSAVREKV